MTQAIANPTSEGFGVEVLLAEPRGFCAGVDRAIEIVEKALAKFGAPIYVRHEIVHNTYVVNDLKQKGAIFIEDLADVPAGATLIFSAHGVSKATHLEAAARGFQIFDATCPLVTKVHVEVAKLHKEGYEFIMIGHKGHPEVEGTMGQLESGIHLVEDVADVAHVSPAQIMEARLLFEPGLAELAVTNATPADFARFEFCLERSEAARTIEEFDLWDRALHQAIAIATHNTLVIRFFDMIHTLRQQAEWGKLKQRSLTPERRQATRREHQDLVKAILDRDPDLARKTLAAHLRNVRANLLGY